MPITEHTFTTDERVNVTTLMSTTSPDVPARAIMQALIDEALNAACAAVQKRLGIEDGGLADAFFQGDEYAVFGDIVGDYIRAEQAIAIADVRTS